MASKLWSSPNGERLTEVMVKPLTTVQTSKSEQLHTLPPRAAAKQAAAAVAPCWSTASR